MTQPYSFARYLPDIYRLRCQRPTGQWIELATCFGIEQGSDTAIMLNIWSCANENLLIHALNQMQRCTLVDLEDREVLTFSADFIGLATIEDLPNPLPKLGGTWTTAVWQLPEVNVEEASTVKH